ncbi:MAG: hypothetical protein UR85_C0005G0008 [Candidatus Nomurabacteria bacterium GW2011_GWF2_35_66]|uniref:DUF916 domain-containing protein n=1 Tax=Candidatus Nomurabacteria bacterium GW2011_GWE1_35_16 TaxID=1618761 RepID=A0A0G0BAT0_9BACT|nr:MAG: hypothetical protein UR55_C0006G0009 [Candidatus Nomurabacteria bacterium GW2011_GWF1_34_20]KKP63237.1 MAG: hypothetical protein UR57_C0007G0009 [Candidatus Nomurabacteria bacterium GW2011_GWE2_34_25]KKP66439.1 MAG: hypothetical protein UR64_C0007G0008 [Candidatus Nomurabacteria bacterium GW2011_GWE1_35_16]KKP83333.1 MAG: hypothetical protein UR85_C0005G0008 [Candidatus Nomurabacteria bacterium GW2011_GWF2_35_66]HAE36484.1 hypothetical protein [Candidatus Nomurabacteria bacterium]
MKINYKKKIAVGVAFLTAFSFIGVALAYEKTKIDLPAQNDFVVEPGKTEIFVNPGENITKSITITNRIGKNIKFKLTTEDMIGTNDSLSPIKLLGDEKGPYSVKNFIEPEISEFSLELGERIVIPVKVSVPLDAEPRGYYGALIVSNEPEVIGDTSSKETEGKARLVSRIGSLFFLRINGEGKESGDLEDFKIIGPNKTFYENRPKGFEIAFKNTGNVHLVPHGRITIRNILGRDVGSIPVDAYFSLPDSIRYREVLWEEGSGLGRYTANLSLFPGFGNENQESSVAFWIIPWKILLATFVGLIVLISFIYYILTRFELRKK